MQAPHYDREKLNRQGGRYHLNNVTIQDFGDTFISTHIYFFVNTAGAPGLVVRDLSNCEYQLCENNRIDINKVSTLYYIHQNRIYIRQCWDITEFICSKHE